MKESMRKTKRGKWLSRCLCMVFCTVMAALCAGVEVKAEHEFIDAELTYSEGMAAFYDDAEGAYGFMDINGNEVVKAKYLRVRGFSDGLAWATRFEAKINFNGGKDDSGFFDFYIDKKGKEVINLGTKYDYAGDFSDGIAIVEKKKKYGFINKKGKEIVKPIYDDAFKANEGMAIVKKGKKWGYVNNKGKEVIKPKYDDAYNFSEGMAVVKKGKKYGYIDKKGKEVVKAKYDKAGGFSDGMALVKKGENLFYINKKGKAVLKPKYDDIYQFSEGLAPVVLNGKCGFINTKGEEVVEPKYDEVGNYSEGLSAVKKGDKWGFIDKDGKEVISPKYDEVYSDFVNGRALVYDDNDDNGNIFIDKTGKKIADLRY